MWKSEVKSLKSEKETALLSFRLQPSSFRLLLCAIGMLASAGCSDTTSDKSAGFERSESALRDPMNYSPGLGTKDKIKEPSPKPENSLKRDLDTVFNP